MSECKFKVGDKIVSDRNGSKVCATVKVVYGNGLMDIDVWQPKLGRWTYVTSGNWEKISKPKARVKKPPVIR